jgi:hypothetical protein
MYERLTIEYSKVLIDFGGKTFCYDAKSKKGC